MQWRPRWYCPSWRRSWPSCQVCVLDQNSMLCKLLLISLREIHVISFINFVLKTYLSLCALMFWMCVSYRQLWAPCGCWELNADPLEEWSVLPAADWARAQSIQVLFLRPVLGGLLWPPLLVPCDLVLTLFCDWLKWPPHCWNYNFLLLKGTLSTKCLPMD